MMGRETCVLCGDEGHVDEVRYGLIAWRDRNPRPYSAAPRCRDHVACRARVEASGEEWPVVDRTPKDAP